MEQTIHTELIEIIEKYGLFHTLEALSNICQLDNELLANWIKYGKMTE